jgi:hypothetical protein
VEERDIVDGERQYSRFALDALIVESGARIPNVEDLLLHFVQSSEVITDSGISERLVAADVPSSELENIIMLFGELTFIGFEVSPNRFDFMYDEQDARKILMMARKTADETTNGTRRFRIHPAFQAFLETKPYNASIPGQMTIDLSPPSS